MRWFMTIWASLPASCCSQTGLWHLVNCSIQIPSGGMASLYCSGGETDTKINKIGLIFQLGIWATCNAAKFKESPYQDDSAAFKEAETSLKGLRELKNKQKIGDHCEFVPHTIRTWTLIHWTRTQTNTMQTAMIIFLSRKSRCLSWFVYHEKDSDVCWSIDAREGMCIFKQFCSCVIYQYFSSKTIISPSKEKIKESVVSSLSKERTDILACS